MARFLTVFLIVVAGLVGLGFWLFFFVGSEHPDPADTIVVLAGDLGRLPEGRQLLRDGVAPILVVSLPPPPYTNPDLRQLCARRRVECFHAGEYSTKGEANTFGELARKHHWRSTVIVSSRYHLRRAKLLFERCADVAVETAPARTTAWDYTKNIPLETGKLAYQLTLDRGC